MASIDLNQIRKHPPLAKQHQGRPARKWNGHYRPGLVKSNHILKELVKEPNVTVLHRYFTEPVPEPGPASKVVDAEDLSFEAESPSQLGHVYRRRAEERANFHDGSRPHPADEILENLAGGAPSLDFSRSPELCRRMRRREVFKRRGAVEEAVNQRPANGLRRNWIGAASCDSERVHLGGVN